MRLHDDFDPATATPPRWTCWTKSASEIAVMLPPAYNRFPNNFSHIFAGGYGAGYYSYKWAEVLSADAYACSRKTACSTRKSAPLLERNSRPGGSRPALESFVAFRGREPTIDALLRHNGMGAYDCRI